MLYPIFVIAVVCAVGILTSSVSRAQRSECTQDGAPAVRIAVCSALIARDKFSSREDRADSFGFRGFAYYQIGEYDKALADLDIALALSPRHGLFSARSSIRAVKQQYDGALSDIERALVIAPSLPFILGYRSNRADIWRDRGDYRLALREYSEIIQRDPTFVLAYIGRTWLYRANGNVAEAAADLARAAAIAPTIAEPYVAQGLLAESAGDTVGARASYLRAVALPRTVRINGAGSAITDSSRDQQVARARLAVLAQKSETTTPSGAWTPNGNQSRRLAIVIGNGAYNHIQKLANPVQDAGLISKNLRKIGLKVIDGFDLDQQKMKSLIGRFLREAATSKIALMFYAGHGMQIDGKNFLLPTDAKFDGTANILDQLTDLDFLLAGIDDKVRTNIVILDACRDNPFAKESARAESIGRSVKLQTGLAPQSGVGTGATSGAGTLLAFATAPGKVALDGQGGNSPFSDALGRHISTPGLEVQQMLTRVRTDVVAATKGQQVPWSNSALLGEVYLIK